MGAKPYSKSLIGFLEDSYKKVKSYRILIGILKESYKKNCLIGFLKDSFRIPKGNPIGIL